MDLIVFSQRGVSARSASWNFPAKAQADAGALEVCDGDYTGPLSIAASAVTRALCVSVHICIFGDLPVSTKL